MTPGWHGQPEGNRCLDLRMYLECFRNPLNRDYGSTSVLFEEQRHQAECVQAVIGRVSGTNNDLQARTDGLPGSMDENRLDVLMETATGKTLAYLMCMMEMNAKFGTKKFLIVVPSKAIKQGVIQNIADTRNYLSGKYNGKKLLPLAWPENQNAVSEFLTPWGTEPVVLLLTYSSFNKIKNKLNARDENERISGGRMSLWQSLVRSKPVVIMDEPHKLAGQRTRTYLDQMRDGGSLFLRFGASFPLQGNLLSNVVYELDSANAFNGSLVKEIEVSTVSHGGVSGHISVTATTPGRQFRFRYMIYGRSETASVKLHEDIGAVTGYPEYAGRTATKINSKEVVLDNGARLTVGAYAIESELMRSMIAATIDRHFEREERLFSMGIKTLSLFFIPRVGDFRGDEPRVKGIFEREYEKIRGNRYASTSNHEYKRYLDRDYEDGVLSVHEGYFSGDRGTREERQAEGVNIILNERERLLSFDTPLRFIFSVWALQEGWDNPNIFNICKLTNTDNDTTKRQQVGRGLRLAVDQHGRRMTRNRVQALLRSFSEINTLNMVVSSYETNFFSQLQKEIGVADVSAPLSLSVLCEYGLTDSEVSRIWNFLEDNGVIDHNGNRLRSVHDFLSRYEALPTIPKDRFARIRDKLREVPAIRERSSRRMISIRKSKWNEFKDLWEPLNRRARVLYRDIDEDSIIADVCKKFDDETINQVIVSVERVAKESGNEVWTQRGTVIDVRTGEIVRFFDHHSMGKYALNIAKDMNLPLSFMLKLFGKINMNKIKSNPEEARNKLKILIRSEIHSAVVSKVEYMFNEPAVYGNWLQPEDGNPREPFPYTYLGKYYEEFDKPNYLYNAIAYDTDIERQYIKNDPDNVDEQKIPVFAKLPAINIRTPFGNYNPDFAYLVCGTSDNTYLVVETKGYDSRMQIPKDEIVQMKYGRRFFECLQKVLPASVKIRYESRINNEDLSVIMGRILE